MKGLIILLVFGLFMVGSALACQYTVVEEYQELELGLYNLGNAFVGPPLEFKDFVGGAMNIQECRPPSFKVYNPLDRAINLNISYTTSWTTAFGPRSQNHQATISINQFSDSEILSGSCPDLGSGSISEESITYSIWQPEILILKNEQVTKQRDICRLCGNEQCLDDGSLCNPLYDDSKCGSGVCNIAGFCGLIGTPKVVDCPNGKLNCQDKICLESSVKQSGESYLCDWECGNGTLALNSTCKSRFSVLEGTGVSSLEECASKQWIEETKTCCNEPNSKKFGEKYFCENECKSGRSNNGKCLLSVKEWTIFWILALIILSAGIGYFAFYKRIKEEKERNKIKEEKEGLSDEIKELKKDKDRLESIVENLNKDIDNLNNSISKGRKKIEDIKILIKNAEGKAKEELEKGLRAEEERQKGRISKLKFRREKLSIEEKNIGKVEDHLINKKRKFEKENREFFIKQALDKYKQRYPNIYYDDGTGYIKFSSQGNEPLHRYLYRGRIEGGLGNKEVHHIDKDKLNNEDENLISLSHEKHNLLNHAKIEFRDWDSGIEELKEQLKLKDSDFPEHIQKELENKRQQKRISNYTKKSSRRRRR